MVPIHESDVAENRWKEDDWRQFELWERIENRFRRKRLWIIFAVSVVFVAILSIPVIRDRMPKWTALSAVHYLAVEVNKMKVDAASSGTPSRLRIENSEAGPAYSIEKVDSCISPVRIEPIARGQVFQDPSVGSNYLTLEAEAANTLGLERVTQSICYDPILDPVSDSTPGVSARAFGIITVKDLAERRLDRITFMNFSGLFAEIDVD